MKLRSVLLLLWLISPLSLSAVEYQCRMCRISILATDEFCPKCGKDAEKCRVYTPVADKAQQPLPQNHGYLRTTPTAQNIYAIPERRTHWTPIKVGFGGVASLPSVSNASVGGLDLEFGAMGDTLCGIGLGWFSEFREIYGVQCSAIGSFNRSYNVVCGLQLSGLIGNQSGSVYGVQVGFVINNAMKEMYGIQIAAVGNSAGKMHGLQIGFYNGDKSVDMCGIQIGVINTAKRMSGIQIGVLNFVDNSPISFFPVVNMCF